MARGQGYGAAAPQDERASFLSSRGGANKNRRVVALAAALLSAAALVCFLDVAQRGGYDDSLRAVNEREVQGRLELALKTMQFQKRIFIQLQEANATEDEGNGTVVGGNGTAGNGTAEGGNTTEGNVTAPPASTEGGGNPWCKPGESAGQMWGMSINCWLSKYRDPEDIEDFLRAHKVLSAEMWYAEHKNASVNSEEWYRDNKNTGDFNMQDWLEAHGLRREEKAVHGRLELLSTLDHMLAGQGEAYVRCGLECWLAQFRDPEDIETWFQAHKGNESIEDWYAEHKGMLPRTEDWYQEHKNMLPRMEEWYQAHKNMLPRMEAWYQEHKNALPRTETWYQEHKNSLPRTEAWYQAHKDFLNFSIADWKAEHGVHAVDMAKDVRGAILWELMQALEEDSAALPEKNASAPFDLHHWLNSQPDFDLKAWLNATDSGFDLDAWLKENEDDFRLSDWLNKTGTAFDLKKYLNETDRGFDLHAWLKAQPAFDMDKWLNESKMETGTTDEFLNKTDDGFDLSAWLDAQIDFDMQAWGAEQRMEQASGNKSAASAQFNLDKWLKNQEQMDMHAWLNEQQDFNLSKWLDQYPEDESQFKGSKAAALEIGRVVMLAQIANETDKPFSLSDWLDQHKNFNLSAWLKEQPDMAENSPGFNLSAWLDQQPKHVVDKWLASLARGEGAQGGGANWYRFAPERESVNMTAQGMCCCGFACDEISFECCGPWIPLQEKGEQTALRQKRMEELMQEGAQQARKYQQLAIVKAQVQQAETAAKKAKTKAQAPSGPSRQDQAAAQQQEQNLHPANQAAARKTLAPIHAAPSALASKSAHPSSANSKTTGLHAAEAGGKMEWECVSACGQSPLRVGARCEVECASADGINCLKTTDCGRQAASVPADSKAVVCGEAMQAAWGTTGYEDPTHWCYCGQQALLEEVKQCKASGGMGGSGGSTFGSNLQFGPGIKFASGDTFGDDNSFGEGDTFGNRDTFGSHNSFTSAQFGKRASFDSSNDFAGVTVFGPKAKFNSSNLFGQGTVFGPRAKFLGSRNEVGEGSSFGKGLRMKGTGNTLGGSVSIGSNSVLGPATDVGAGSKFGANIVLGEGTKVGEGSSFLGAKEEGKEGGAAMSAVPQGEVEEYYRPDPGSAFARKGPTKVDTRLEGENYWPTYVDKEEEEGGAGEEGEEAKESEGEGGGEGGGPAAAGDKGGEGGAGKEAK